MVKPAACADELSDYAVAPPPLYPMPRGAAGAGHDPYDAWAIPALGTMKVAATQGSRLGFAVSGLTAGADLLFPMILRKLSGIAPKRYTHTEALRILAADSATPASDFLDLAEQTAIKVNGGVGWGYPFDWYSRNAPRGVYRASSVPFITVTPYVMEALMRIGESGSPESARASRLFDSTWGFLEALRPMTNNSTQLALSYAPAQEKLKIINSNAYAAYAYALHARYGAAARFEPASGKCRRLTRWVVDQQEPDGAWWYLGESRYNNFIDCFHSCFTVKNLIKTAKMDPSLVYVDEAVRDAWAFIRENFYDPRARLCRRFLKKGTKDPLYAWDIYDQAEYLGLLIDFGLFDEALAHRARVAEKFYDGNAWYCRIDIFGRRWGKNFLRWGIMPFLYHSARLDAALRSRAAAAEPSAGEIAPRRGLAMGDK